MKLRLVWSSLCVGACTFLGSAWAAPATGELLVGATVAEDETAYPWELAATIDAGASFDLFVDAEMSETHDHDGFGWLLMNVGGGEQGPYQFGIRTDFGEDERTALAVGRSLSLPNNFSLAAHAFAYDDGVVLIHVEPEWEIELTPRWSAALGATLEAWTRDDDERALGAGLSSVEAEAKLSYAVGGGLSVFSRYAWEAVLGETRSKARTSGEAVDGERGVLGLAFSW